MTVDTQVVDEQHQLRVGIIGGVPCVVAFADLEKVLSGNGHQVSKEKKKSCLAQLCVMVQMPTPTSMYQGPVDFFLHRTRNESDCSCDGKIRRKKKEAE